MGVEGFWAPSTTSVPVICTSGTRPSSPVRGQQIYETDTDSVYWWDGTNWTGIDPGEVAQFVGVSPEADSVQTQETTTSTSYTDLSTAGPSVTLATYTTVLVFVRALLGNSTLAGGAALMSFEVSGASTIAANDDNAMTVSGLASGSSLQMGSFALVTGLTAGTNTFTCKYRCGDSGGTGSYARRHIAVLPFPF